MVPIKHAITQFFLVLIPVLGLIFFVHLTLLKNSFPLSYGKELTLSYGVNALLAAVIFILLYRFRLKLKNSIGFLFMTGSFLKFLVFFLIFYPEYKADGQMDTLEFATFFVPYAICLVVETYFTAKILREMP